jgi:hypothetical protein
MSYSNGPRIVTDGLVLYLDAGNSKSYPGSGSTWYDLSGYNNHATLSTTAFDTDKRGNILFDAAADSAVITHSSLFNFNSSFTVSACLRVNVLNLSSIYNVISKKASFNNTQKGWSCQLDYRNTGIMHYRNNDGTVLNDSTQDSTVNNTSLLNQTSSYKHLVWVLRQSPQHVWFYIDGVLRSGPTSILYTNTDTSNNLYIGKTVGSGGDGSLFMNLSNLSIYNRTLTASEILQNYNATKGRFNL